jgi:hypothetical protein
MAQATAPSEHYYSATQYYSDKDARVPTAKKQDF